MKLIWAIVAFAILLIMMGCSGEQPVTEEQVQQQVEQPIEQSVKQPIEIPSQTETSQQPTEPEIFESSVGEQSEEDAAEEETQEESEETQVLPAPSGNERCYDPDATSEFPDGINFNVATEILVNGKKLINGKDYCPNVATISEWYCQDGIARVKTVKCPTGSCKEGVCA